MILHAVQEKDGYISEEAVEWVAKKLDLQPINIHELLTFTPCSGRRSRVSMSSRSVAR